MTDALGNALAKRDKLERELANVQIEIARIDAWVAMYREFSEDGERGGTVADNPDADTLSSPDVADSGFRMTRAKARPIIREIIVDNGAPMQRGALLEALDRNGTPVGGREPSNNLGTMMWRMKDTFINLEGFGYWPVDLPYEPAAYLPQEPLPPEEQNEAALVSRDA